MSEDKRPTLAQYHALNWAAVISQYGGVWAGDGGTRADVTKRCRQNGWLCGDGRLTRKGYEAWLAYENHSDVALAKAIEMRHRLALLEDRQRAERAAQRAREAAMFKPPTGMSVHLTFNEWAAVIGGLNHMMDTHRVDAHGVDLVALSARLQREYQKIIEKERLHEWLRYG